MTGVPAKGAAGVPSYTLPLDHRDSENCIRCPEMEWSNKNRTICIARIEVFLSYTNYVISVMFSSISVLFFFLSLLISEVFISHRDTPIVRANNRSLSFLLLVSIKLSFLSVFLFLGRPVDITCRLRNITFGITFSIAVSSLLAKTIMVCVAFKATKPGSSWRKWVGVKLSNSVVLFCSSIQIIICMTWLAISPPFQELDLHTYPGTIIIQCNEGSAIGFYSVIGYMGLLAAVSFVLAFLARTLPDSFNEAKYITFSMLLFCSVWITMIPAYLSTKGKNTVCLLMSTYWIVFSVSSPKKRTSKEKHRNCVACENTAQKHSRLCERCSRKLAGDAAADTADIMKWIKEAVEEGVKAATKRSRNEMEVEPRTDTCSRHSVDISAAMSDISDEENFREESQGDSFDICSVEPLIKAVRAQLNMPQTTEAQASTSNPFKSLRGRGLHFPFMNL
ncbi:vomeronasal type-2 receptor 26-like [Xenopus laevis]|uniref:Vomeronasal type-2 receptor 26-like n=1 Tax=Xenopus laevis TaxID=8355 RepID=A0A8J1LUG0_XENLA|nr:vomeronasal type-2 receptor 26-like [Xenopus laevis]